MLFAAKEQAEEEAEIITLRRGDWARERWEKLAAASASAHKRKKGLFQAGRVSLMSTKHTICMNNSDIWFARHMNIKHVVVALLLPPSPSPLLLPLPFWHGVADIKFALRDKNSETPARTSHGPQQQNWMRQECRRSENGAAKMRTTDQMPQPKKRQKSKLNETL